MLKKSLIKFFYKIIHSGYYSQLTYEDRLEKIIKNFKSIGICPNLPQQLIIKNPQYIRIGDNFSALINLRLEAWDAYGNQIFKPELLIGNNVCFNTDIHIGCINKIIIGNNVLMASGIFISDHSHGDTTAMMLDMSPINRPLISKGPVIIEDNVWIGERACVLPNVTIGKNSIIGANAVVTKSFPANSVVAGNPAKLIKTLK